MKNLSTNNTFKTSDGVRLNRAQIETRIRKAKALKIDQMLLKYGYLFCEECQKNDCKPIDVSHEISVDECLKAGRAELAFEVSNLKLRGRPCHRKHDKNAVGY